MSGISRAAVNVCLTYDPSLAGLYRAVNDFAVALDAPILSFDDGRADRSVLAAPGAPRVRRIPSGAGWLSRNGHTLTARAARQGELEVHDATLLVVHSLFRAHAPWAARVAQARRIPYWAIPHGCLDPWGLKQRAWLKRTWLAVFGSSYFEKAAWVVFATRREAEKARPWIPINRSAVIHWPVEVPECADREARRHRFRVALGVRDSQRLLLTVGRLHSMKRPIETVEAFCAADTADCHLAVVGMDDEMTAREVEASVPIECRGRVTVVGPLSGDALMDSYCAADGYISLSFRENFGYAVAEAVGHGLPVILSPGHDLAHEMPHNGEHLACGWLLPDDDRNTAVAAITEFSHMAMRDRERRGLAGAAWARDMLAMDRFRNSLQRLAERGMTL